MPFFSFQNKCRHCSILLSPDKIGISLRLNSILLLLTLFSVKTTAQFHLNGSARQISDRCFQLTPEQNSVVGSIWDTAKINLTESFDVNLDLFFGCKDADGADGIVFGFQPVSTSIGQVGEGMGFLGVSPSIGIAMDTYQNANRNDPAYDHMTIIKNGDINLGSANTLAGPISLGLNGNIEDCKSHNIRVKWDAVGKKLEVLIDCEPKLSYTGDIVNTIFNGDPNVFWGFTAATGGFNNRQEVCFRFTTLLDKPTRVNLCKGDTVRLQAYGGETYRWTPSAGLDNPSVSNPIARPDTTTTYTVVSKDKCGVEYTKDIRLVVNGDPILFDLGRDTALCQGQTLKLDASGLGARQFLWSNGAKDSVIYVKTDGTYSAILTRGNCSASDTIKAHFIAAPSVKLGNDTALCFYKKLILNVLTESATYRWQDGSTLAEYPVAFAGIYNVFVSNRCGLSFGSIVVDYKNCHSVYVPTAFSPNGDGVNDVFMIFDGTNVRQIKRFAVFDRWGSQVFSAMEFKPNDAAFGWNGEHRGQPLSADVYVWYAEIEFADGEILVKKGDVTLMR